LGQGITTVKSPLIYRSPGHVARSATGPIIALLSPPYFGFRGPKPEADPPTRYSYYPRSSTLSFRNIVGVDPVSERNRFFKASFRSSSPPIRISPVF